MKYVYQARVLQELEKLGVRPVPTTPPELLHEFVSDLYRYELRRLKMRLVSGEISKRDYSGHVVALRKRYLLVSLPVQHWAVQEGAEG